MARFVTKDRRLTRRLGTHTLVLTAVIGVTLASACTRTGAAELAVATVVGDSPDSGQALPAQRALGLDTQAVAPGAVAAVVAVAAGPVTQGADQRQALAFNPRQGLPQWLRTIKD